MTPAILGLLAQIETISETTISAGDMSVINMMMDADLVCQIMFLALGFFSVVSWAIIGSKYRQLKKSNERSKNFFKLFWQAKSIDAVVAKGSFRKSPAFNIFKSGIDILRENQTKDAHHTVEKELRRATEDEIAQMEYGVPFLATTGTAAPFIGLFGTIWGILHAFWKIGRTGASSISIIGPDIAEALISTAIGLAAAIPAVVFYNHYVNRIRFMSKDLYDFAEDYNERIGREYFGPA